MKPCVSDAVGCFELKSVIANNTNNCRFLDCALLMKLWRLSQLMRQFRRKVVKSHHVLAPFGVLMICTTCVLTVWQILDPLVWEREIINRDPLETYGECQVDGNILAYIVPLGLLVAVITTSTAVYAWKLRDVQSELAESRWIFFGIFTHLQTWAIGIPIDIITDDTSREAGYMMFACLSFIFSTTMVGFVIWPKIYVWAVTTYFVDGSETNSIVYANSSITSGQRGQTCVSGVGGSSDTYEKYMKQLSKGADTGSDGLSSETFSARFECAPPSLQRVATPPSVLEETSGVSSPSSSLQQAQLAAVHEAVRDSEVEESEHTERANNLLQSDLLVEDSKTDDFREEV